jgi:hypothetical protein
MRPIRPLAAAVAAGLVFALSACSGDDTPSDPNDLVAVAKAFHDCLQDAGLAVDYETDLDGQSTIVTFADDVHAVYVVPGGYPGYSGNLTESEIDEFMAEFEGVADPEPMLRVEGVDHTDVWVQCYESSGYDEMKIVEALLASPVVGELFSLTVEASNEWAKCARENGWPGVKDAVMSAKAGSSEVPMALLPTSITEDQLRALLETCPIFDPDRAAKNAALLLEMSTSAGEKSLPEGYVAEPSIGFDYPGFDGKGIDVASGQATSAPPGELTDKLTKLMEIVYEEQLAFYEENDVFASAAPTSTPG